MARQKAEAKGRAARKAAKTSREAGQAAVELRAAELAARVRESEPVTKAQALTSDLAERVRDSEAVQKAQTLTTELAGRVREAKLDERANELADRARTAVRDAHLDQRAADLAARVRESDPAQRASEAARRTSDQTLERVGSWLATSKTGERLGVVPAKRRRFPVWLGLLLGAAAGYLVAKFTSPSRNVTPPHEDPFAEAADRLVTPAEPSPVAPPAAAAYGASATAEPSFAEPSLAEPSFVEPSLVEPPVGPAPSAMPSVPPAASPLADEIRSSLDADPRTAGLPGLAINVADSTVFVRGSVPEGFDETSIREVVAAVPGVTDVDLQVSPA